MYKAEWNRQVNIKPKLRTLKLIKRDFHTERHLHIPLSRSQRSLLSQCRGGVLPIRIETGRFHGLAPEERICELSNLGEIENEIHFLLDCPFYNTQRRVLFQKCSNIDQNFMQPMNTEKLVFL